LHALAEIGRKLVGGPGVKPGFAASDAAGFCRLQCHPVPQWLEIVCAFAFLLFPKLEFVFVMIA
jgi:hypothetical protein